jgi:DNA ligase (NAD+)
MDYEKINDDPWKYGLKMSSAELVKLLKHLSDSYYNTGETLVNDDTYDILREILEEKDPKNKYLQSIGAPVIPDKEKCKLKYFASSLDKKKPIGDDIKKWLNKFENDKIVSDKLDGVSAIFSREKNGDLLLCTRGDGYIGQNINFLIEHIFSKEYVKDLPSGPWCIRGELVISKKNFKILKDLFKSTYNKDLKNARNTVAGLVNSKTINEKRKIIANVTDFVAYSVFEPKLLPSEQFKWLDKNDFELVNYKIFDSDDKLTTDNFSEQFVEAEKNSKYEIDGLVVIDDAKYKLIEGKKPKYAFAFKNVSKHEIAEVKVLSVEWNASIDIYLKPTVLIETAYLAGVKINRATAFNAKYIFDNKIGKDAIVQLVRSGDVIPHILKVIKKAKTQEPDGKWKWNASGVDIIGIDTKYKMQSIVKLITNFFKVLEVKNVGEGIIQKFVNNGYDSIKKILMIHEDEIANIDGMGEKIGKKIVKNIKESIKNVSLEQIMVASHTFGRGFGETKILLVLKKYPNILDMDDKNLLDKISNIHGYNVKTAKRFVKNLPNFKKFMNEIKDIINIDKVSAKKKEINNDNKSNDNLFNNEIVVFTGIRNKSFKKFIEDSGGRVASTVSGKTTLLIAKDPSSTDSKIQKAKDTGIKIISYDDFAQKYKLPVDV